MKEVKADIVAVPTQLPLCQLTQRVRYDTIQNFLPESRRGTSCYMSCSWGYAHAM
jgi:hypothetical protein